jgi:hypothetical protein
MFAFHGYDLYCQVQVRALMALNSTVPLEQLFTFNDLRMMNTFAGSLVSFRERAYGKGIQYPRGWKEKPTGAVQFRKKHGNLIYRTVLSLRTMYVFSDTAAEKLRNSRVCGVGIFGGATSESHGSKKEIRLDIVPLIIGFGGFGQSDEHGLWDIK